MLGKGRRVGQGEEIEQSSERITLLLSHRDSIEITDTALHNL